MTVFTDLHALMAIASLHRLGKPDLSYRIMGLFNFEFPENIAALQPGLSSANLQVVRNSETSIEVIALPVNTPI